VYTRRIVGATLLVDRGQTTAWYIVIWWENACAEGDLECVSASYRLFVSVPRRQRRCRTPRRFVRCRTLDLMELSVAKDGGEKWGVLLLAHGAPDRLEDIPAFLLNVRGGRKLPEAAVNEIMRRYGLIGGSPLLRLSTLQAQGLAKRLGRPIYLGMRNWKPFISDAVRQISADGVERVVAICLAPQNSRTSIGLYKRHLFDEMERLAPQVGVDFIENWHDHPGLVEAFRERVATALACVQDETGGPVPVIFTAHSVPQKTIEDGDPYERQVKETASLVARALGLQEYDVCFQSQGMTAEPWIGPTVESLIDRAAAQGRRHLLLAPVGFVCDHIEILYDIDVVFREYGRTRGVTVHRSESLNDSPLFIEALAAIAGERAARQMGR
jgi:protoporphyrin/coproporphyrin ferrochelatase